MNSILYSRKLLAIVLIGLLATGIYISYQFTIESVLVGTAVVVLILSYVWLYTSRHVNVKDSVSVVTVTLLFLMIGSTIGSILGGSVGSLLYTLSLFIVFLGLVYALTRYVL